VPGNQQARPYLNLRRTHTREAAAAKAGLSTTTGARQGLSDFTDANSLGVTVAGLPATIMVLRTRMVIEASHGHLKRPWHRRCFCVAAVTSPTWRVENGYRVLFMRTTDIVQRLQAERQALQRAAAIAILDRFDRLIVDDLPYVSKDQAETSVLFELIAARYERRSL
jgi:hypothetical protein